MNASHSIFSLVVRSTVVRPPLYTFHNHVGTQS
jgi:hypothetical protein